MNNKQIALSLAKEYGLQHVKFMPQTRETEMKEYAIYHAYDNDQPSDEEEPSAFIIVKDGKAQMVASAELLEKCEEATIPPCL